jgi:hypothetical protein
MSKHLKRPARPRSRVAVLGALAVAAASVTAAAVALGQADASNPGATAKASDLQASRTYACPGTALHAVRSGAATVRLTCATGVGQVGRTSTLAAPARATARIAAPAGADSGTVLVTTVLTRAGSTVALAGWTEAYDGVSGPNGLRLSAWYRTGTAGAVTATVTPAARVSMITTAFDGARSGAPVSSASTSPGRVPPAAVVVHGAQRVTAVGVRGARVSRGRAHGTGTVVVNGNTRLTQVLSATGKGATTASVHQAAAAVAGTLSVVPRPAAAVPAGALTVAPGGSTTASCDGAPLTYTVTSPTVVTVTCDGSTPSASASPSPTASPATSPTTSRTTPTTSPTSTTSTTSSHPTISPSSTTSAPTPVWRVCSSPVFRTSDPNGGWSESGYYVHNNMWNISKYPSLKETLEACSHASWNVTATADDSSHNGEVKTYPNVHVDYHGSGANGEPAWSSFKALRSTFAAQGPGVGVYDVAYDIWMNGVPGNREIMIWTENHGQRPAGNVVASGVVLSGISWDVWAAGDNGYLAFVPRGTLPSGALDLKAMIDYLVAEGRVPANSTLGQVCFGVEVVSTGGTPASFRFTDFSVTSS